MNIASGTWKKYEAGRLERLRVAAEDENKQNGIFLGEDGMCTN
jgi:hypothetical protein